MPQMDRSYDLGSALKRLYFGDGLMGGAIRAMFGRDAWDRHCDGLTEKPKARERYVCGFLFDEEMENVVLIRKRKPKWQEGLLNGVGGKVEHKEIPAEAMQREFLEETGLDISSWDPIFVGQADGGKCEITFYRGFASLETVSSARTVTDEEVCVMSVREAVLRQDAIKNLCWLIPLSKYEDVGVLTGEFR